MSPERSRGTALLVFQYGSNMDRARLNSSDRLDGLSCIPPDAGLGAKTHLFYPLQTPKSQFFYYRKQFQSEAANEAVVQAIP